MLDIFQKIISSIHNEVFILKRVASHAIVFTIFLSFAYFVVFNSPIEAFPFPTWESFTNDGESYFPTHREVRAWTIPDNQKRITNRIDPFIILTSPFSIHCESVEDNIPDEGKRNPKQKAFCGAHCELFLVLSIIFGGYTLGTVIAVIELLFF